MRPLLHKRICPGGECGKRVLFWCAPRPPTHFPPAAARVCGFIRATRTPGAWRASASVLTS